MSECEISMLSRFARKCGVFRIYVILGDEAKVIHESLGHKALSQRADAIVFSKP